MTELDQQIEEIKKQLVDLVKEAHERGREDGRKNVSEKMSKSYDKGYTEGYQAALGKSLQEEEEGDD